MSIWRLFISSIAIFIYLYLDNGLTSLLLMQSGFSCNYRIRSYKKVYTVRTELFWKSTGHVWWSMRVRRERSMASSDTTISRMMARPLSGSRIGMKYWMQMSNMNIEHHFIFIYQQIDTWCLQFVFLDLLYTFLQHTAAQNPMRRVEYPLDWALLRNWVNCLPITSNT